MVGGPASLLGAKQVQVFFFFYSVLCLTAMSMKSFSPSAERELCKLQCKHKQWVFFINKRNSTGLIYDVQTLSGVFVLISVPVWCAECLVCLLSAQYSEQPGQEVSVYC